MWSGDLPRRNHHAQHAPEVPGTATISRNTAYQPCTRSSHTAMVAKCSSWGAAGRRSPPPATESPVTAVSSSCGPCGLEPGRKQHHHSHTSWGRSAGECPFLLGALPPDLLKNSACGMLTDSVRTARGTPAHQLPDCCGLTAPLATRISSYRVCEEMFSLSPSKRGQPLTTLPCLHGPLPPGARPVVLSKPGRPVPGLR